MQLSKGKRSVSYFALASDAGTETNDGSCAIVPGPACRGEALSYYDEGEGFLTIHNGIHGFGKLNASIYDWRNPVAKIVVTRVYK